MSEKVLYRSVSRRIFAGVCAGLGNYFNIDPVIVRLLFFLLAFFGGGGLIIYIVLWIVIPEEPIINQSINTDSMENQDSNFQSTGPEPKFPKKEDPNRGSLIGGLILITLGGLFLADRFIPRIDFGDLWPVLLVLIGIYLIVSSQMNRK